MKKLLTVLILIPSLCFAQKKDSVVDLGVIKNGDVFIDSLNFYTGSASIDPTNPDTVAVIMLICDTTKATKIGRMTDGKILFKEGYVWWQLGYEVKHYYSRPDGWLYQFVSNYLDWGKKPITKQFYVWMSKEIN